MHSNSHDHLAEAAGHLCDLLPGQLQDEASISTVERPGKGTVLFVVYLPESVKHFSPRLPTCVDGVDVVYEFSDPYAFSRHLAAS